MSIRDHDFHPLCKIFPVMNDEELTELANDIKANGLRQSITLLDGLILDGRNRYLACERAEVKPKFKQFKGDGAALVASLNIHRRHLTTSQRAMVAAELVGMKPGRPETAQICAFISAEKAAEKLNVSARSVDDARKIKEHGSAAIQQAVIAGDVSVSKAAKVADLPKRDQLPAARQACNEFSGERMRGHHPADFYQSIKSPAVPVKESNADAYPQIIPVEVLNEEEKRFCEKFVAVLLDWRGTKNKVITIDTESRKGANNAEVSAFIAAWCASFKRVFKRQYQMTPADKPQLRKFLIAGEDWNQTLNVAERAWSHEDFYCKKSRQLSSFVSNIENIRTELTSPKTNGHNRIKPDYTKAGW